jgi:high-affinity Fe2+/Pb2+ permease
VVEHVWDINHVLPEKSTFGRFLTAIVGYNGNPSLVEVVAYPVYLVLTLVFYFRPPAPAKEVRAVLETRPTKAS